jgi:uncharacterized membrane protein HdeD (DUF308 family)
MNYVHEIERLAARWWMVLLRGLLALAFAAVLVPAVGAMRFDYARVLASVFVQVSFGVYLFLASLLAIWLGITTLPRDHWPISVGHSALLVLLSWWFFTMNSSSIVPLAVLVAIHAVVAGTTELRLAMHLRRHQFQSNALFVAGFLSYVAAIAVLALHGHPARIALATSAYAALFGAELVAAAFRLRALRNRALHSTSA